MQFTRGNQSVWGVYIIEGISDYGHEILPLLPSYVPPYDIRFTTLCHVVYRL